MQQKKSPGQYQLLLLLVDPCFKQEQQQKKKKHETMVLDFIVKLKLFAIFSIHVVPFRR